MEIRVEVGAAVLDDSEAEIGGGGFEKSREHDAVWGLTVSLQWRQGFCVLRSSLPGLPWAATV